MDEPAIAILIGKIASGDTAQQVAAAQELVERAAYQAIPALTGMGNSSDAAVRSTAAAALGALGVNDPVVAGQALLSLLDDPEAIVRSEAVDALGVLRYKPAAGPVRSLLTGDADPIVRAAAAETLGDLGDPDAVPELEMALADPDAAVRGYAANSLGLLGAVQLVPELEDHARAEPSMQVRAELYGALYRLGVTRYLSMLLELLASADQGLAVNILNVLADLAGRESQLTPSQEAALIRRSLASLTQRIPMLSSDADHVITQLERGR
jgi:HEAT repeat protein